MPCLVQLEKVLHLASKLRFADLTPLEYQKEAKMYYDENVTLNILGQPMTGNTKKYL